MPGPVSVTETAKWPLRARARGDAHLAGVGELDGVANEVEQYLRQALFVTEANWERLLHLRRQRELLVLSKRLCGRAPSRRSNEKRSVAPLFMMVLRSMGVVKRFTAPDRDAH